MFDHLDIGKLTNEMIIIACFLELFLILYVLFLLFLICLNQDCINPADSRLTVAEANRPTVGRFCADFTCVICRLTKKILNSYIFFHGQTVLRFW